MQGLRKIRSRISAAAGGAGAYMASCVKSCEVIAFKELQSEAVHRLEVADMRLITAVDAHGGNLFPEADIFKRDK